MPIVTGLSLSGIVQVVAGSILGALVVRQVAGPAHVVCADGAKALPPATVKGVEGVGEEHVDGCGCAGCVVGIEGASVEAGEAEDDTGFIAEHRVPHPERHNREGVRYADVDAADDGLGATQAQIDAKKRAALKAKAQAVAAAKKRAALKAKAQAARAANRRAAPTQPRRPARPRPRTDQGPMPFDPRSYGDDGTDDDFDDTLLDDVDDDMLSGWAVPYRLSQSKWALPVQVVASGGIPGKFVLSGWAVPYRLSQSKWALPVRDASAAPSTPAAITPPQTPAKTSGWAGSPTTIAGWGDQLFKGLEIGGSGVATAFLGPEAGAAVRTLGEASKAAIDRETGHDPDAGPYPVSALFGGKPTRAPSASTPPTPGPRQSGWASAPPAAPALPEGATRGGPGRREILIDGAWAPNPGNLDMRTAGPAAAAAAFRADASSSSGAKTKSISKSDASTAPAGA